MKRCNSFEEMDAEMDRQNRQIMALLVVAFVLCGLALIVAKIKGVL